MSADNDKYAVLRSAELQHILKQCRMNTEEFYSAVPCSRATYFRYIRNEFVPVRFVEVLQKKIGKEAYQRYLDLLREPQGTIWLVASKKKNSDIFLANHKMYPTKEEGLTYANDRYSKGDLDVLFVPITVELFDPERFKM